MSATLYWKPISKGEILPHALRLILTDKLRFFDYRNCGYMGAEDLPYLRGLRDAGVDGAGDLVEAVEKHGKVQLWIQS